MATCIRCHVEPVPDGVIAFCPSCLKVLANLSSSVPARLPRIGRPATAAEAELQCVLEDHEELDRQAFQLFLGQVNEISDDLTFGASDLREERIARETWQALPAETRHVFEEEVIRNLRVAIAADDPPH